MASGTAPRTGSTSNNVWPVSESGQADSLACANSSGDLTASRRLVAGSTGGIANSGGFPIAGAVSNKTSSFSADSAVFLYTCDTSGGSITVTLPACSGNAGLMFAFKKTSGSNNLVLDGNASENVDSGATLTGTSDDASIIIVVNAAGTEWHSIARYGTWA